MDGLVHALEGSGVSGVTRYLATLALLAAMIPLTAYSLADFLVKFLGGR